MTDHHRDTIMARRQDWADKALADPLFTPERRCYGTYFQKNLTSGQQTNCYVGIGFLTMLPANVPFNVDMKLDEITGHIIMHINGSSVSRETRRFYDLPIGHLNKLMNMSDRGSSAEAINHYMLNCPISEA